VAGDLVLNNVHVTNSNVTGSYNVGGLVGSTGEFAIDASVKYVNCSVTNTTLTANGAAGGDPTGASAYIGRAFGATTLVFEGNNVAQDNTYVNENGLVGGGIYGYTAWENGGFAGTGVCNSFTNWKDVEKVTVSDFEILNQGKSYTYLTVEHLKKQYSCQLYFIVGGDMLTNFKTWKNPERILSACDLAVFDREDFYTDYSLERQYFLQRFNKEFVKLNYCGKSASSTKIRVYSAFNLPLDGICPNGVEEYIKEKNLYGGDKYTEFIKNNLPLKRIKHTADVVVCALQKAKDLGLDQQKVQLSATLHDCAKYLDYRTVEGFNLPEGVPAPVVHSFLGAFVAEKILGVTDMSHSIDDSEFVAGGNFRVYDTSAGKIGILIGEDLFFPESSRVLALCDADFIVCIFKNLENLMPQIMLRAGAFSNGVAMSLCAKNYACVADIRGEVCLATAGDFIKTKVKIEKDYHLISSRRRGLYREFGAGY
jgi:nicotinate (nicotinamide) nucleotide adenylyltransferase